MDEKQTELSPQGKLAKMFAIWLSPLGVRFISPEAEQAYRNRVTRIENVIQLRVPDRVPIYVNGGFFSAHCAGMTPEEAMYDYDKLNKAWRNHILDLQPDAFGGTGTPGPGRAYEILDYKLYLLPGHGIPGDAPYQCAEAEYMRADEYDALIQDPSDFWLRTYLPRIFGALEPLKRLRSLEHANEMPFTSTYLAAYGSPEVRSAFEALLAAGEEAVKWSEAIAACNRVVIESGFPLLSGGWSKAPFDVLADTLRGTRGIALDMYRQPDKLLEALDRLTPLMTKVGVTSTQPSGRPLVFIPLHKGADGFMSDEQYRIFYWASLKKVILGLVNEGLIPYVFAEGAYNTRLEIVRDIPRGRTIWHFDYTDMARAKEALGDIACIAGNVPISLLSIGHPDEVKDYCKKLIDVAGRNGGFILASGAAIDTARRENVQAMIEFTREYGVYS
ncbi:MAG: hypothetical protein HYX81_02255 [Chloroflexi bacterium]|nr:hypothetical protein [Chloroflexota bacterium]MBI4267538.1 hypothetical protein [Chloroflexota bacterium]